MVDGKLLCTGKAPAHPLLWAESNINSNFNARNKWACKRCIRSQQQVYKIGDKVKVTFNGQQLSGEILAISHGAGNYILVDLGEHALREAPFDAIIPPGLSTVAAPLCAQLAMAQGVSTPVVVMKREGVPPKFIPSEIM